MDDSEIDYRLVQKKQQQRSTRDVYLVGPSSKHDLDALFYQLAGKHTAVAPTALSTQGRRVFIPQAALAAGLARFTFADLCQKALGAADYLVIGQHFHTVFCEQVPVFSSLAQVNWARRFITFVDVMYECRVKLIVQAQTPPGGIFAAAKETGASVDDEVFAFARTVSRLEEMFSERYLQTAAWVGHHQADRNKTTKSDELLPSDAELVLEPSLGDGTR